MNITIGNYYNTNSVIHKLDPRVKIICFFLYTICMFIGSNLTNYLISSLFLIFIIFLSKIPFYMILKSLKNFLILFVFTTVFNILLQVDGEVLLQIYFIKITSGGLRYSFQILFRLIMLILSSIIFTLSTTSIELSNSIESLLKPLKKVKLPVHEIALMVSIALRFIPTIAEEFDRIKKAQMSRGVDFETGSLISRIKAFIPLLIPIFVASFKRADELSTAMEARCYRGDINRTKMKQFSLNKKDFFAISIFSIYFLIILYVSLQL